MNESIIHVQIKTNYIKEKVLITFKARRKTSFFFWQVEFIKKKERTINSTSKEKKTVSTLQGHSGLVTVWLHVVQGRVVLLMSMVRNEDDDDDVGRTGKEKFTNAYYMKMIKKCRHTKTWSCQGDSKLTGILDKRLVVELFLELMILTFKFILLSDNVTAFLLSDEQDGFNP